MLKSIFGAHFDFEAHLNFIDELPQDMSKIAHIALDFNDCDVTPILLLDHHEVSDKAKKRMTDERKVFDPEYLTLDLLHESLPDGGASTKLNNDIETWLMEFGKGPDLEIIAGTKVASCACLVYLVLAVLDHIAVTHVDIASYRVLRTLIIQDARNFKADLENQRWTQFDVSVVEHIERLIVAESGFFAKRKKLRDILKDTSSFGRYYEEIGSIGLLRCDSKVFRYQSSEGEQHSMHWASVPKINNGLTGWMKLPVVDKNAGSDSELDRSAKPKVPDVDLTNSERLFNGLNETLDESDVDVIIVWIPVKDAREVGFFARTEEIRQKYLSIWSAALSVDIGFEDKPFFESTTESGSLSFHHFANKNYTRKNTEPLVRLKMIE